MNRTNPDEKSFRNIRRLIWLYFWLLLLEGALRKWVLPSLSNPLLIVRDPVVILAYLLALRAGIFPWNRWVIAIAVIGILSVLQTFIPLWRWIPPLRILAVAGFGFRSNFLHLPLIFLIGRVFDKDDVKRLGWWTLALMVPMTLLLIGQFQSGADSFLNRTAGGEGEMLGSALGKVRTAGTFSFVIGVVAFYALGTGFLIWGALRRDVYKLWLLAAAAAALVIGVAVSGSRSVVGACAVVAASLALVLILRPSAINRFGQTLLIALVLGFIVSKTPIFKEGANVLGTRFSEVAEANEKSIGAGLIERFFGDFQEGFSYFIDKQTPFFGYGLGVGTNAGAKFLTGQSIFLLSESEWSRVFLESGPILGLAFLLWRASLVWHIGVLCLRSIKLDNVLPILLFSSSFLPLISGQFGQPTVLGFCVFVTGLALAARNDDAVSEIMPDALATPITRPLPRRSPYASRLHGTPPPAPDHSNGFVDR